MSPEYREIPIDNIRLSPFNTRGEVSEEEIAALAETLKQSRGNDVPLKVRPLPNAQGIGELYEYEVVYGERRVKALKLAGIQMARCIVEDMDDSEVLMQQWMENEEHKDLSDYAKAQKLKQILDATKLSQAEVSAKLGKEQNWVSRHLSMLRLEQLIPRGIIQQLSEKQARAILSAPDEDIPVVCAEVERYYEEEETLPSAADIVDFIKGMQEPGIKYADTGEEALPETGPTQLSAQGAPPSEPGQQEKQPPDHEHVYDAGSTHCRICGRELTAPESVKAGIGPICAGGKPRASPEEIYASIHDLYTRFENPNPIFVVRLLQQKHGLSHEGAQQALSDYKKRPAQPPSLTPATTSTPETKADLPPKEPITILVEVRIRETPNSVNITWSQKFPVSILPGQNLEITVDGDLVHQETAVEPEEAEEEPDEGVSADEGEYEEEEEALAAESDAQAQEEDEDSERKELELEEEHSNESTGPEEEE